MKSVNFGIDLGTTNSLIAKYDQGNVTIYKNPVGHKETLASVVAFRPDRRLVGDKAREYLLKDSVNVFGSFKRKMGTDERYYVVNLDENVTPIQLSSYVLMELKNLIHSGEVPEAVIVTIPASFDTMQSNATIKAATAAGFSEVFLLQEPIAASLAYFNQVSGDSQGNWLVYDLGGGTFDVALVNIQQGDMKVLDHEGNNFLGGVDIDFALVEQLLVPSIVARTGIENFEEQLRQTYGPYEKLYHQLLYKTEEAKKELSAHHATNIEFELTVEGQRYEFDIDITREQLNEVIAPTIQQTLHMLQQIITRNQLTPQEIRQIILVGGSTLIPYVREQLQTTGISVNAEVDPTTAVAVGAAYYAANKYYHPKSVATDPALDALLERIVQEEEELTERLHIDISYSKSSQDEEELLLIKTDGDYERCTYRIIRNDGAYDSGVMPLKSKSTEFLPLMPGVLNKFFLRVYDEFQHEIKSAAHEIAISHGEFSISGQPLPRDICIEVDDKENKTTKLELVFEKNSILPQKKTLYRTISKTITKGADEKVIINIVEGDRYARPISNLPIGCIEISGTKLTSDLIKGSDIEIQITMTESRSLSVEIYLVMTQQEFKNVFSLSEKQVSVARLKEQYDELERELRNGMRSFSYESESVWMAHANDLLEQLLSQKKALVKLKETDKTDARYIIAETVNRISQAYDKLGGNERLESLQFEYFEAKEFVETHLSMVDHNKDRLQQSFRQLTAAESQLLRSRNSSVLERAIEQLNKLGLEVLYNTNSFLISRFAMISEYSADQFTNYNSARSILQMAQKSLDQEKFVEFRQHFYNLTHLLKYEKAYQDNPDFKGTGIG